MKAIQGQKMGWVGMHDHATLGSTAQEELRSSHTYQVSYDDLIILPLAALPSSVESCMTIRSHLPNPCTTQYNEEDNKNTCG